MQMSLFIYVYKIACESSSLRTQSLFFALSSDQDCFKKHSIHGLKDRTLHRTKHSVVKNSSLSESSLIWQKQVKKAPLKSSLFSIPFPYIVGVSFRYFICSPLNRAALLLFLLSFITELFNPHSAQTLGNFKWKGGKRRIELPSLYR